ncbi:bifunctional 2-C-methyl-D-erythritol 4-phosphate cytidylyltransferase/2-C-methyl-D-erythritol 2,4-cyclodiphosphate synthase [Croceicoccus ponticola]|uniref:Bifunctional enzyme IspD/IspF n=1 Tax=Croceicoccus ponticola TaxID=2217664 RepID=A0A437H0R8_9SPHN|nr:bifunctional 2-C-methyl-D-erythritol 4-phosphate cytidylyltransferase/2-C-methyl-D-erythritol 2,4-cyclodiphosphate synthase [Croceicoccus ponticola]RVQ69166.1 bifunctional 2-C-methyl-D-erythritol 4-phosphate cytidylyltransferase/2-C-methyl-D-erythritol 2,4-cyclodiphosphate synthase [Croceicoccus ponticola]
MIANEDPSAQTVAIVVAAGRGERAGSGLPKQYRAVAGRSLVAHCLSAFTGHPAIDRVICVIGEGQEAMFAQAISPLPIPQFEIGGAERRDSVANALAAIVRDGGANNVLVHDAARPFCPASVIDALIAALADHDGAVPALPVVDTLARGADDLGDTVPRDGLWRIQTPQAFRFETLLHAHRKWPSDREATDDAQMVRAIGGKVAIVEGHAMLEKLTHPADFARADAARGPTPLRIGSGYDVHRLVPGEGLWLCGVHIAHDRTLSGHSDADVALHALTDAILGAAALGDIGQHFPPSDSRWKGAASHIFLSHAASLARDAGYAIANADITIICEAPKVGPHRDVMRARIAELLNVDIGSISVKATTTERLGFTGRGEGIAAQAQVLLCTK